MKLKRRIKKTLIVVCVLVAVCIIGSIVHQWLMDRPIDGGIVAFRATDRNGRLATHCACGHKGYIILTERYVLWYVSDHDSIQPNGEILSKNDQYITFRKLPDTFSAEGIDSSLSPSRIEIEPNGLGFNEGDYGFSLKKTYLSKDIRERVEAFDVDEWERSNTRE